MMRKINVTILVAMISVLSVSLFILSHDTFGQSVRNTTATTLKPKVQTVIKPGITPSTYKAGTFSAIPGITPSAVKPGTSSAKPGTTSSTATPGTTSGTPSMTPPGSAVSGPSFPKPGSILACQPDKISVGTDTLVVKTNNGLVWGWGSNRNLALGDNHPKIIHNKPKFLMSNAKDVFAGAGYTLILRNDGTLWYTGKIPGGPVTSKPAKVPFTNNNIDAIANNVLIYGGYVYQWGSPYGTTKSIDFRIFSIKGLRNVVAVAAGLSSTYHPLALDNNGKAWIWYWRGTKDARQIAPGLGSIDAIAAGNRFSLLQKNGRVYWVNPQNLRMAEVGFPGAVFPIYRIMSSYDNFGVMDNAFNWWMYGNHHMCQLGNGSTQTPSDKPYGPLKMTAFENEEISVANLAMGPYALVASDGKGNLWRVGKRFNNSNDYTCEPEKIGIPAGLDLCSQPPTTKITPPRAKHSPTMRRLLLR